MTAGGRQKLLFLFLVVLAVLKRTLKKLFVQILLILVAIVNLQLDNKLKVQKKKPLKSQYTAK